MLNKISRYKQQNVFFGIVIMIALLSQFPDANKSIMTPVTYIVWGLAAAFVIYVEKSFILTDYLKLFIIAYGGFFIMQLLVALSGRNTSISTFVKLVPMSAMIYYIFFFIGCRDEELIWCILNIYRVMIFILAIYIIVTRVNGNVTTWMNSEVYLMTGSSHKNTLGQLLGCGFLEFWINYQCENRKKIVIKLVGTILLIVPLLYVQSRSALIALGVCLIYTILVGNKLQNKIIKLSLIALIVCVIFNSEFVLDIIKQAFLINKYSNASGINIATFSSGRTQYWKDAIDVFQKYFCFGVGDYYVDNFYLAVLAQSGIFGGLCLFGLIANRMYLNFRTFYGKRQNRENDYLLEKNVVVISVFYIVMSVFECFPPFGPGVASMLFWMLSGAVDGKKYRTRKLRNV